MPCMCEWKGQFSVEQEKKKTDFLLFHLTSCTQPLTIIYKSTWTQSAVVRSCTCPAAVLRRLLQRHLQWRFQATPPPSPSTALEQIKWTQWFFNQITYALNRLTFLREVLFPLSLSLLFLSPKPEREKGWRPTNFNLHYLLWFLC